MPPPYKFDVFLSFASLNESMAKTLYNQLIRSGLEVFWSDETLKRNVGMSWPKLIEESLEASKHMVVLWTDEAMHSHWVDKEYRAFDAVTVGAKNRLLIPVLGDGAGNDTLPLFLRTRQSYPLNGDLEQLITSLGGRYEPIEQENERLREALEEAMKEIQLLTTQQGGVQQADVERIAQERDEWKQKFADLENKALEQSTHLSAIIEEKAAQLSNVQKQIASLEKELAAMGPSNPPSVTPLAKTLTDDHGIEFILIEPGAFLMGDEAFNWTKPVHRVDICKPFYLGKYPVTQAEWEAIWGNNPSAFPGERNPVESVSWGDVQDFLKKINNGAQVYQLPTEAQWEYACRAGTTTAYSFGDNEDRLGQYAWYSNNSSTTSHPVGEKKPNPWGLFDMHGNVWEWVQDYWREHYEEGIALDPTGPETGSFRVSRGGSWYEIATFLRSSLRISGASTDAGNNIGFRLTRIIAE